MACSRAAAAVVAVVSIAGLSGTARAERVLLRSGEAVFGEVDVARSDETTLVFEDYLAGGRRALEWDAVDAADMERLLYAGSTSWVSDDVVPGERVVYRSSDGIAEVRGVVERVERGVLYLRILASRSPAPIALAAVVSREPIGLDPAEIGTIDDLFAARRDALTPLDAGKRLRLAAYGERIGAFEESLHAYERAASDVACPLRAVARAGVTRMTMRVVEQRALRELAELRADLAERRWQRVRDGIDAFAGRHPDASDAVRQELAGLRAGFAARRLAFFAREAGRQLEPIVRELIEHRVAVPAIGFNDVQAWAADRSLEGSAGRARAAARRARSRLDRRGGARVLRGASEDVAAGELWPGVVPRRAGEGSQGPDPRCLVERRLAGSSCRLLVGGLRREVRPLRGEARSRAGALFPLRRHRQARQAPRGRQRDRVRLRALRRREVRRGRRLPLTHFLTGVPDRKCLTRRVRFRPGGRRAIRMSFA